MQFRNARIDDIPVCIALLRQENECPLPDATWRALPYLWEHMLREGGLAAMQVFESGDRLIAFRFSAFLDDDFTAAFMQAPHVQVAASIWERAIAGRSPLLDRQAVARANPRRALNLGVLHAVARKRSLSDSAMSRLYTMLPAAFQVAHAGYRIRKLVCYELFDAESVRIMRNFGLQSYAIPDPGLAADLDAASQPGSTVFYWDQADPDSPRLSLVSDDCAAPRLRLSPAQQRLLMAALEGRADREIAASLGVRVDTLRQTWEAIYRRVDEAAPRVLSSIDEGRDGRRGSEKRRNLVEYCRQHPEELRPWDWRESPEEFGGDTLLMDHSFEDTMR